MQSHKDHVEIVLALDIGGSFIKSAIVMRDGTIKELPMQPSCSAGEAPEIFSGLATVLRTAGDVDAVGVAIPGPFDYAAGISWMEHKFGAIRGVKLADCFSDLPVRFIHDANAFLLGEIAHGAARGFRRTAGITLGTGLGAAFAVDGKTKNNEWGSPAAEVTLWQRPLGDGIAEDRISSRGLLAACPAESVKLLAERARNRDPASLGAWRSFGEALAEVLTPWYEELKPEVIVVGGQIARDLDLFDEPLTHLPLKPSVLGEKSALLGAAELWFGKI